MWWEAGAQRRQCWPRPGDPDSAWNGRIYNAAKKDKKPFAVLWDHQALDWQGWNVVKGSRTAMRPTSSSRCGRADRQHDQTNYISYGPGNKDSHRSTNPDPWAIFRPTRKT